MKEMRGRRSAGLSNLPADLGSCHGGVMRIRRAIIIPVILALGAAGSVLAGSAISTAAGHAPSVNAQGAAGVQYRG